VAECAYLMPFGVGFDPARPGYPRAGMGGGGEYSCLISAFSHTRRAEIPATM